MQPGVHRLLKRLAVGGTALAALGSLVCGVGWRYGFSALPQPVPGFVSPPLGELRWSEVTTNNAWHWFRELDRQLAATRPRVRGAPSPRGQRTLDSSAGWAQIAEDWAQARQMPESTREEVDQWLAQHPEVELCFRAALACPQTPVPASPSSGVLERVRLLTLYPLVLAGRHELAGQALEAFRTLLDAWRFQALLTPPAEFPGLFDERGADQLNALLARPWRRLALTGPPLPHNEITPLLTELAAVTNRIAPLADGYQRLVQRQQLEPMTQARPDWSRVRSAFRVAGLRLRQDIMRVVSGLLERLLGGRRPAPLEAEGARHFLRPLGELMALLQKAIARPEDFALIHRARLSRALAELGSGQPTAAGSSDRLAWPKREQWSWWRRALDRPAVWRAAQDWPDAGALREAHGNWLTLLESCRLTLALRAYREQHAAWPERWADLVPTILPAAPADPFAAAPFGYEREGDGWQFWSVGPSGKRPAPEDTLYPPQRLFRSDQP